MPKAMIPYRSEELTRRLRSARSALSNAARWKKPPAEVRPLERDFAVAKLLAHVEDTLRYVLPPTPEQTEEIIALVRAYAESGNTEPAPKVAMHPPLHTGKKSAA